MVLNDGRITNQADHGTTCVISCPEPASNRYLLQTPFSDGVMRAMDASPQLKGLHAALAPGAFELEGHAVAARVSLMPLYGHKALDFQTSTTLKGMPEAEDCLAPVRWCL
mmetsp:Transcript_15401/g.23124  ORF Transcript_15401/g.23124 Transcript_15401/m.23124 type:complete len:110 (-) Transcript_15401:943-1272(-)